MYNIITLIKTILFTIINNPFFQLKKNLSGLFKFYEFICENNPLFLDYLD